MTTLREAAQHALEVMQAAEVDPHSSDAVHKAITALRAALAEPNDPVAYDGWVLREVLFDNGEPVGHREPTQEPVAWLHTDPDNPRVKFLEWREDEPGYRGRWSKTPLYTTPPQRKPLTEEEIQDCFHAARNAKLGASKDNSKHRLSVVEIARAIERAHGIGGQDE